MGQVKKLLYGNKIPDHQSGGKFYKNGMYVGEGEELYKQLASYLSNKADSDTRWYANDFLSQYANGTDFHSNGNYSNYIPTGETEGWTEDGTKVGKTFGAAFNTKKSKYYKFLNLLNGFNYVAPEVKEEKPEETPKTTRNNRAYSFDYNDVGKKTAHYNLDSMANKSEWGRFSDYLNWLENPEEWEKTNSWGTALTDAQRQYLQNWYKEKGSREAAQADIDSWLAALQGTKKYSDLPETLRENLALFNFNNDATSAVTTENTGGGSASGGTGSQEITLPDGKVAVKGEDGKWSYKEADTQAPQNDNPNVEVSQNESLPTLISYRSALGRNRPDLAWGITYNGIDYSVDDINKPENANIKHRMLKIQDINNNTNLSQEERLNALRELINIPDDFSTYEAWTPGYTVQGLNFDNDFKNRAVQSAAVSEYDTTADGSRIFKYYNNGEAGSNPWGFRQPYYLVYDSEGRLKSISDGDIDELVYNAGVGNFKKPSFIGNALGPIELEYKTPQHYTASSNIGSTGTSKMIPGKKKFNILKENDNYLLVSDIDGNQYIYNKKTKVLTASSNRDGAYYFGKKEGGKIDSSKVAAFSHKHGGKVVKAQLGWKSNGWTMDDYHMYAAQGLSEDEIARIFSTKKIAQAQTGNTISGDLNATKTQSDTNNPIPPATFGGGDPVDPAPFIQDAGNALYDTAGLVSSLMTSNKNRDEIIKGAWNSIWKPTTAQLHGYSDATPVEDAQLDHLQRLIGNVNHANTSSNAVNNALTQYDWANLLPQLNQVYRAKSQRAQQIQEANTNIANQQSQLDATAENDLRQQVRSARQIESAAKQAALREKFQSLENFRLQQQSKFNQASNLYNEHQKQAAVTKAMEDYNADLENLYTQYGVEAAYKADTNASKYLDMQDWLERSDAAKVIRNRIKPELELLQQKQNTALSKAALDYGMPYRYRLLYQKSGGKVRNRYKNEPAEDIWINQNKATHSAVGKLNDNIVRIFLKTLK